MDNRVARFVENDCRTGRLRLMREHRTDELPQRRVYLRDRLWEESVREPVRPGHEPAPASDRRERRAIVTGLARNACFKPASEISSGITSASDARARTSQDRAPRALRGRKDRRFAGSPIPVPGEASAAQATFRRGIAVPRHSPHRWCGRSGAVQRRAECRREFMDQPEFCCLIARNETGECLCCGNFRQACETPSIRLRGFKIRRDDIDRVGGRGGITAEFEKCRYRRGDFAFIKCSVLKSNRKNNSSGEARPPRRVFRRERAKRCRSGIRRPAQAQAKPMGVGLSRWIEDLQNAGSNVMLARNAMIMPGPAIATEFRQAAIIGGQECRKPERRRGSGQGERPSRFLCRT